MKKLNITNGDSFNEYFCDKFDDDALPFREVMMDGEADFEVFSDKFIERRALSLGVSEEEYKEKAVVFNALMKNSYDEIILWFGKDTFCQMNLLTLLAFLEQIGYQGKANLNYIDDSSREIIQKDICIELGIYRNLYEKIIIKKTAASGGVLDKRAIELYFDYNSPNGILASIVKSNSTLDDFSLICLLLEKSEEFGLSDVQAKNLITWYRK